MYLTLLDMDKFVRLNNLKEITDSKYTDRRGLPTTDGLFSNEIFGIGIEDRSTTWAYIDLGVRYLHPLAAINFKKYGKMFENIIYGTKTYRFESGNFIEDPDGDTGIDFLYDHYDEIEWRSTESISSNERIEFLKQGKEKIFLTKFPVCPPYYRDLNEGSSVGVAIVNDLYRKLIDRSTALKRSGAFSFFGNTTKGTVQKYLIDIYNYYITMLKGKLGLMRRSVMGRNVDFGVWCVIASPSIDCDRYEDMPIDYDHMGMPLAAVLSAFKPFIVQATVEFFENEFIRKGKSIVLVQHKNGEMEQKLLSYDDPMSEFTQEYISSQVDSFINGYSTRFKPIKAPKNNVGDGYMSMVSRYGDLNQQEIRPMTWTDVFYRIALQVTQNKSVMWSRYPITSMYSIQYPLVRVLSTTKTKRVTIDGVEYKWYPVVEVGKDSSAAFMNTAVPFNPNIMALGADYDGDSTPLRSLYTTEANLDAERFRRDKRNFLSLQGENIRFTERDFVQILYSFTKPTNKVPLEDPN